MSRSEVLVSADWAESHLDTPGVVFIEVDEDVTAYGTGHLPGAVKMDWKQDLQDPVRRDVVDKDRFEVLLSSKGIANDDTVVLYGGLPQEQPYVAGHVPGAINLPWSGAANDDGTFKSDDALRTIYAGVDESKETIAYCRVGERSSHTWFVLSELLGRPNVKNYDGSWTEYGSLVGVPVASGSHL